MEVTAELGKIFGDGLLKLKLEKVRVEAVQISGELAEDVAGTSDGHWLANVAHDFGMRGWGDILADVAELFEKFFSRPKADKLDRNVLVGNQTAQLDQLTGEVNDPDRLAHIEGEDFTP